ncbi:hypothetical protein QQF64_007348 [Cirrhinus molitorella]|uniref:Uncharacterized protein n=1 Tax=Cirrhinus molitorella TaxID=172907 RepID=A0ABR3MEH1_9TELE
MAVQTMLEILGHDEGYGRNGCTDIPGHFLDARSAALRVFGRLHTFQILYPLYPCRDSTGLDGQQVCSPGGLSKDVKSTEDPLLLFPYI